ncbi:GNAT family N-acetyltransferase [Microbacterium sp. P01]|uniref:GNAT family N-acetyltransferase n=1 Tax=Microbacterium sp. P01 TaxID=3366261 RepID=UPI00367089F8
MTLRRADLEDLDAIVRLLFDDPGSAGRGDVTDQSDRRVYGRALAEILKDPANELVVAINSSGRLVGMMQLTAIPGMTNRGRARLFVEAVRIDKDQRSSGIGAAMMRWLTGTAAPAIDASLVQLLSEASRSDAHRFYRRCGFIGSDVGFTYRV